MATMPRHGGGFSVSSKLLQKRWDDRAYQLHMQKVHAMKPKVQNSSPQSYGHLALRLKKVQKEEERQADIEHNNQILLQKMTKIMRERGRLDNWNDYESRSLNQSHREKELENISQRNMKFARRLERVRPMYAVDEWEEEYKKHEYLQYLWENSTKDYPEFKKEMEEQGIWSEEFESESDIGQRRPPFEARRDKMRQESSSVASGSVVKLPKINQNQNQKGGRKETITEVDARQLFRGCKELGIANSLLIKHLVRRNHSHRLQVKAKFEDLYDLNLESELKNALGEKYEILISVLLTEKDTADADSIHEALTGSKNQAVKVMDILASKTSAAISALQEAYKKKYDKSLEEAIKANIIGECQPILLAVLKGSPSGKADEKQAQKDAEELHEEYQSGEGRWTNENGKLIKFLNERSVAQQRAIFNAFKQLTSAKDITEVVSQECSEEFAEVFYTYSKHLRGGTSSLTDTFQELISSRNSDVIKMLVTYENDLPAIRKMYKKRYGVEMADHLRHQFGIGLGEALSELANRNAPPPKGKEKEKNAYGSTVTGAPKRPPLKRPEPNKDAEVRPDNPLAQSTKKPAAGSNVKAQQQQQKKDANTKSKDNVKGQKGQAAPNKKPESEPKTHGTVKAAKNLNLDEDVRKIHEAMKGFGTDEEPLIRILTGRSNEQRQQIKKKYQEKYKSELMDDLKSELTGDFEESVLALMMEPVEYDAYCLHDAVSGMGTREAALIGILCTRNAKEIKAISDQYKKAYDQELSADLESDTSGDFKDLLLQLAKGERDQSNSVNQKQAEEDAKNLHENGLKGEALLNVLGKKSRVQVRATIKEYEKLSESKIEEAIKKELGGDDEDAYLGLVKAIQDPVTFYAERLHGAMYDAGTNEKMLIRIIVSRSEVDLMEIKKKYKELYKTSLYESVENDTSGDFQKLLLAVIGEG